MVLAFIRESIARFGFPPTCREICDEFGWSSTNAAHEVLVRLERAGSIKLYVGKARGMTVIP